MEYIQKQIREKHQIEKPPQTQSVKIYKSPYVAQPINSRNKTNIILWSIIQCFPQNPSQTLIINIKLVEPPLPPTLQHLHRGPRLRDVFSHEEEVHIVLHFRATRTSDSKCGNKRTEGYHDSCVAGYFWVRFCFWLERAKKECRYVDTYGQQVSLRWLPFR